MFIVIVAIIIIILIVIIIIIMIVYNLQGLPKMQPMVRAFSFCVSYHSYYRQTPLI